MSTTAVISNLTHINKEDINKVQQGLLNRHWMKQIIREYPAVTPTIMAYETGLRLKTIQHQLKQLADRGEIYKQRRGMGEEFLYRDAGKGRVKQIDHILNTADSWATIRKATSLLHIGLEDELPKDFTSSKGTTEPDLVFSLRPQDEKKFYTWEEDLGSERGKEVFLKKLSLMWWWRHEYCHERVNANVWGIKTITVLTNTTTNRHMENLRKLVRAAHPDGKISLMFLFTSREQWHRQDPKRLLLAPIWLNGKDNMPRRLVE